MACVSAPTWCCGRQVRHRPRCWRRWSSRRIPRDFSRPPQPFRAFPIRPCSSPGTPALRGIRPTPKAGVYAVRQGPVLLENLRRVMNGRPPRDFVPQHRFMKLLNTGDGRAIGEWRDVSLRGQLGVAAENGHRPPLRRALPNDARLTPVSRPAEHMRHYAYVRRLCKILLRAFFTVPGSGRCACRRMGDFAA